MCWSAFVIDNKKSGPGRREILLEVTRVSEKEARECAQKWVIENKLKEGDYCIGTEPTEDKYE